MNKSMVILVAALALTLGSVGYGQTTLAYESFESHNVDDVLVSFSISGGYTGLTPDIGTDWILSWVQPQESGVVGDVAYAGTKGAKLVRGGPGVPGLFTAIGTGVPIDPGKQYVGSSMYMAADDAYAAGNTGGLFLSSGPTSTYSIDVWHDPSDGQLKCGNGAAYIGSGYYPQNGKWYQLDLEVTIGAPVAGIYALTYDAFVTDELGVTTQLCNDFPGWETIDASDLAFGWELNLGCNRAQAAGQTSTVYYDEMKIIEVPEPATMTLLAVGLVGLLRRKR